MRRIFVDGVENGGIPGDDPGFTRGMSAFESMRTYGHDIFRLQPHLDRLRGSCATLDVPLGDLGRLRSELEELAREHADSYLRVTLTGGGRRVLEVGPIDQGRVGAPITVATVTWEPLHWLPGTVKHGSRAGWIVASRRLGVDEVMLVDRRGEILECNRSNVFAVTAGVLRTPALGDGLLEGVTRGALLDAAERAGIPCGVGPLPRATRFDELYVSSTLKELAPVASLDGVALSGWGDVGHRLAAAFADLVASERP